MALTQGHFQAYDFNRMVVLFTMMNDEVEVPCAVSTDAMDRIEGSTRTTSDQREQQFLRLRDRIEERAARKFLDFEFEGNPPGIVLRSIDFRPTHAYAGSEAGTSRARRKWPTLLSTAQRSLSEARSFSGWAVQN